MEKKLVKVLENTSHLRAEIYQVGDQVFVEKFNQGSFLLSESASSVESAIKHAQEWIKGVNLLNEWSKIFKCRNFI